MIYIFLLIAFLIIAIKITSVKVLASSPDNLFKGRLEDCYIEVTNSSNQKVLTVANYPWRAFVLCDFSDKTNYGRNPICYFYRPYYADNVGSTSGALQIYVTAYNWGPDITYGQSANRYFQYYQGESSNYNTHSWWMIDVDGIRYIVFSVSVNSVIDVNQKWMMLGSGRNYWDISYLQSATGKNFAWNEPYPQVPIKLPNEKTVYLYYNDLLEYIIRNIEIGIDSYYSGVRIDNVTVNTSNLEQLISDSNSIATSTGSTVTDIKNSLSSGIVGGGFSDEDRSLFKDVRLYVLLIMFCVGISYFRQVIHQAGRNIRGI